MAAAEARAVAPLLVGGMESIARSRLITVSQNTPLVAVAAHLSNAHISVAVVCDAAGVAIGTVTETLLVRHLGLGQADIFTTRAGDVMTKEFTTCSSSDLLSDMLAMMHARGVCDDPRLFIMQTPRFFSTSAAFRDWLVRHAASASELIVGFYKVDSGHPSMTWSESVDEALCFGWIDGVRKRIDDESYLIRFTPRKPSSIWSAINIAKVERLQKLGLMRPAGLEAYAHRKDAKSAIYSYEQAEAAELSAQELKAFRKDKKAWAYFEAVPPGYRKQMVHRITSAKRAETRAARFLKLVQACSEGKRLL